MSSQVARLEQRAADEAADHEPDAGRGPQQAVAERAAVQRSLARKISETLINPVASIAKPKATSAVKHGRRAPERAEPVARGHASDRA